MSITTKTLATIMLVAMLTLSTVSAGAVSPDTRRGGVLNSDRETRQLERLYKRHDRKFEIRSSVLGMEPDELREKLKTQPFERVVKKAGFKDAQSFHIALVGKLKDELRSRGWGDSQIKEFIDKRLNRYARNQQ